MATLRHPVTGGQFDCPDESVQHYRAGGWLTVAEHDDWVAAIAAADAVKADAETARVNAEADAAKATAKGAKGANDQGQEK